MKLARSGSEVRVPEEEHYSNLLRELFSDIQWRQGDDRNLPTPAGLNWQTVFVPKQQTGILVVDLKAPALATAGPWSGSTVIRFDFLARGQALEGTSAMEACDWFQQAHEWILASFLDLTSEKYRLEYWQQNLKGLD